MINICLCGEKKDDSVSNVIDRVKKRYNEFYINEIQNLRDVHNDCDMLIFKNSFEYQKCDLNGRFLSVVDSQNKSAISVLRENNLAAITCGMSFKDTLSISSLSAQKAIVSLQRSIVDKNRKTIEPKDVTVIFDQKTGVYPILVSTVILLIACPNIKNEYKI